MTSDASSTAERGRVVFLPWLNIARLTPLQVYIVTLLVDRALVGTLGHVFGVPDRFPGGNWSFVYGDWFLPMYLAGMVAIIRTEGGRSVKRIKNARHWAVLGALLVLVAVLERNNVMHGYFTVHEELLPPQLLHDVIFIVFGYWAVIGGVSAARIRRPYWASIVAVVGAGGWLFCVLHDAVHRA